MGRGSSAEMQNPNFAEKRMAKSEPQIPPLGLKKSSVGMTMSAGN